MSTATNREITEEITIKLQRETNDVIRLKKEGIERLTQERTEQLKSPYAILAKDAGISHFRTNRNMLVRVERKDAEKKQVEIFMCELKKTCLIPEDTVLFSDIGDLKTKLEEKAVVKEQQDQDSNTTTTHKKRVKGESKTSYIDDLLKQGKELDEVVRLTKEKFTTANEIQLKKLAWSRRAVFKKKQGIVVTNEN